MNSPERDTSPKNEEPATIEYSEGVNDITSISSAQLLNQSENKTTMKRSYLTEVELRPPKKSKPDWKTNESVLSNEDTELNKIDDQKSEDADDSYSEYLYISNLPKYFKEQQIKNSIMTAVSLFLNSAIQ